MHVNEADSVSLFFAAVQVDTLPEVLCEKQMKEEAGRIFIPPASSLMLMVPVLHQYAYPRIAPLIHPCTG